VLDKDPFIKLGGSNEDTFAYYAGGGTLMFCSLCAICLCYRSRKKKKSPSSAYEKWMGNEEKKMRGEVAPQFIGPDAVGAKTDDSLYDVYAESTQSPLYDQFSDDEEFDASAAVPESSLEKPPAPAATSRKSIFSSSLFQEQSVTETDFTLGPALNPMLHPTRPGAQSEAIRDFTLGPVLNPMLHPTRPGAQSEAIRGAPSLAQQFKDITAQKRRLSLKSEEKSREWLQEEASRC
jgi:hypothetical protein